jgi:two-component system, cell cycle response regulator
MDNSNKPRWQLLLIEDDDADALLVERALERYPGFQFRHVRRMQSALEILAAGEIDAVLLDLSLPDSFGIEGISTLQKRFPDLPVVVLTGLDNNEMPLEALERGAQDYLCKGKCSPEALIRVLRYSIQRQQIQGENRRLLEEMARQARHDALTGILNRRSLVAEFEREWQRAARGGEPLSCVMIDIDFFKRVNDVHGHKAGDLVLQAIANLLTTACRTIDISGRYGGEEFLVLLPDTAEAGALAWAEHLRQNLAATSISVEDEIVHVTASFGVAERTADLEHCEQLIDQADQALRTAKQLGRDKVVSYHQTLAQADGADTAVQDAFARLTAGDIMTPLVATLEASASLQTATELLLNLRLDSAPLVDNLGNIVGIIGEEKLSHILASADAWRMPVADVMNRKPICFAMETPAVVIQDFLARAASRRVVILDGQRPVGIVSRSSILRWREYLGTTERSLLTDIPQPSANPDSQYESLLTLVAEIGSQAAELAQRLTLTDDSPVELTVAAATRIHSLLEDAVTQSQRLNVLCSGASTLSAMMG